jgi:hypothetical protein
MSKSRPSGVAPSIPEIDPVNELKRLNAGAVATWDVVVRAFKLGCEAVSSPGPVSAYFADLEAAAEAIQAAACFKLPVPDLGRFAGTQEFTAAGVTAASAHAACFEIGRRSSNLVRFAWSGYVPVLPGNGDNALSGLLASDHPDTDGSLQLRRPDPDRARRERQGDRSGRLADVFAGLFARTKGFGVSAGLGVARRACETDSRRIKERLTLELNLATDRVGDGKGAAACSPDEQGPYAPGCFRWFQVVVSGLATKVEWPILKAIWELTGGHDNQPVAMQEIWARVYRKRRWDPKARATLKQAIRRLSAKLEDKTGLGIEVQHGGITSFCRSRCRPLGRTKSVQNQYKPRH